MLSEKKFVDCFVNVLCPHFRIDSKNNSLMEWWFESFQEFSDESFEKLCRLAFAKERMPRAEWFREQMEFLAEADRRNAKFNPVGLIESSIDRELGQMTEAEMLENQRRFAILCRDVARISKNDFGLLTKEGYPVEPFRQWILKQPIPVVLQSHSQHSIIRLQSRCKSVQATYLESLDNQQDEEDCQEW